MAQGSPQVKGFDTVLVLDFGAQYGQLIARRVRECRVYSELVPHDVPIERIKAYAPKGIILSGGPMSVYVDDAPQLDPEILELGIPVLGICYGMQSLALHLQWHRGAHRPQRVRQDGASACSSRGCSSRGCAARSRPG